MISRNRHTMTAMSRQGGFTIIELMVVIAIFGLLAVTSYASMLMAERQAVHNAVNYIMSDLITARNEAIKGEEQCAFNFNFAPAVRNYAYNMLTSGRTKTVWLGERFRDDVYFLPGAPGGAADPAPINAVTFSPRGLATNAVGPGGGQIYLTDQAGFNTGTGKVYRIVISGSGEVEAQIRDFTNPTWSEFN